MAKFSQTLQKTLSSNGPKTLEQIIDTFAEKNFAILFLLLLAIPALPLPTGGITHIFEIIAMLLAIELIAGRKTVWLPKKWLNKELPKSIQTTALPKFISIIKWIEKYSKPRLKNIQLNSVSTRFIGLIILIFTIFAFIAPPFSGLDTLPSLGVLLLSLAIILEDSLLSIIGLIVGGIGIGLIFLLGRVALQLL